MRSGGNLENTKKTPNPKHQTPNKLQIPSSKPVCWHAASGGKNCLT
jgi:hypothetical protein